ncbi:MAG TPA: hypothetical protein VF518_12690 [Polyangia bacterium]
MMIPSTKSGLSKAEKGLAGDLAEALCHDWCRPYVKSAGAEQPRTRQVPDERLGLTPEVMATGDGQMQILAKL